MRSAIVGNKNHIVRSIVSIALSGVLLSCQSNEPAKTVDDRSEAQALSSLEAEQPGQTATNTSEESQPTKEQKRKLIVYYFHTTYRCHSCNMIETLTKTAIETGFADQIKTGRIEFRPVNIETAGNEHFAKDYKLYTKSVVLSDLHGGKETRWKNLEQVWKLLRSEHTFMEYVQNEIQALL